MHNLVHHSRAGTPPFGAPVKRAAPRLGTGLAHTKAESIGSSMKKSTLAMDSNCTAAVRTIEELPGTK